ncbi:hypothetical protein ACCO45_003540 [Purpureocillium lilacinum]|uniref:Uncharacterized protein n=1 Tax=Purpureocillium lilacinum TaxID=33203 RepID=A0ACC4E065_PURLI
MGTTREYRGPSKKRLYLAHPEPDTYLTRRRITRFIPPSPPPPPPPVICEPPPPPPPPPIVEPLPDPIPEPPCIDPEPPSSHSRRETREKEVYIERDRFVPVPVPVPVCEQPRYETYRYVEPPPRRPALPPPPPRRRSPVEEEQQRITINIDDRHRSREYYDR